MFIKFEYFRGFKKTDFLPVRPVTLLVGENSAGKTSFQAALRFMLAQNTFESQGFNAAPFYLGGFQDIAYSIVGRHGVRASKFSLSMRRPSKEIANGRSWQGGKRKIEGDLDLR